MSNTDATPAHRPGVIITGRTTIAGTRRHPDGAGVKDFKSPAGHACTEPFAPCGHISHRFDN